MSSILNYGSMNLDYFYTVDHIVQPGETIMAGKRQVFLGGKGLNQSIAMARAGGRIYHAGVAGADGDSLVQCLSDAGVDTRWIKRVNAPSSHTFIQVDGQGQNSIVVYADEAISFTTDEMETVLDAFGPGDVLILQNELAGSPEMMRRAHRKGLTVILNPSPVSEAISAYPLEQADWFLLNELEGAALTGETDPSKILDSMQARYPQAGVVLTLGQDGACCRKDGRTLCQPAFPVKAVDTTAAGDTFTGFFVTGLMRGDDLESVLRRAARAAAMAVSRRGAAASIPTAKEVDQWL